MTEIRIRPFQPQDQEAARTLILAGLGEHFGEIDTTRNPDIDDIWFNYIAKGGWFLVAESSAILVGTGALMKESHGIARIVRMSVSPAVRRQGLARRITQMLIATAQSNGFAKVVVETNVDWYPAIELYRSCGFTPYDVRDGEIHMELTLSR